MNIYEALQEAEKTSGVIYRPRTETCRLFVRKDPYEIRFECDLLFTQKEPDFKEKWVPSVDDLMSTDWKVWQDRTGL